MPFCIRCGTSNVASASFCAACGQPIVHATPAGGMRPPAVVPPSQGPNAAAAPSPVWVQPPPAAPPPYPQTPAAPSPPLAGLGGRFFAVILDAVLGGVVFAIVGTWAALRWGGATESGFNIEGTAALITLAAVSLFGFFYYWLGEGLFGATLGKGIVGIAVARKDGRPCGLGASLVRNLLRIVDGFAFYLVGFLVALFSVSRQRLGDHAAGTLVVRRRPSTALRAFLVVLWFAGIVLGIVVASVLHREAAVTPSEPQGMASSTMPATASSTAPIPPAGRPRAYSGDLKLVDFAFLQSEDGPRRPSATYQRGDTVYIKYDINGFTTGPDGRIDLLLQAVVRDPAGLPVHPLWEKELVQTVPKGAPVNGSLNAGLPSYAPPGTYRIDIKARDKFKNTLAEYSPTFQLEGPPIAPAAGLEFRDFGLSTSSDGPLVALPAFEGAGTVYMRWRVMGMQARDDRINVRIGLRVFAPGGNLVLDAPDYVSVDDSFPYRPQGFFVSMSGHVSLPGGAPKGIYTARYLLTDNIARTQIERTARLAELR